MRLQLGRMPESLAVEALVHLWQQSLELLHEMSGASSRKLVSLRCFLKEVLFRGVFHRSNAMKWLKSHEISLSLPKYRSL